MASQVFTTTGSQTWNWPVGVTTVTAECLGAGGGSGDATGNPATGGGGKGGGYSRKQTITKGAETFLTIVVGAPGAVASAGGFSSVTQSSTTVCLGTGGGGGASMATSSANGAGGTTLNGTAVGDVVFNGGNGGTGAFASGQLSGAGGGAGGPTGGGGNGVGGTAGVAGTGLFLDGAKHSGAGAAGVGDSTVGAAAPTGIANQGGGASGGKANNNTDRGGWSGRQGIVVLTWTIPDQAVTGSTIASTGTIPGTESKTLAFNETYVGSYWGSLSAAGFWGAQSLTLAALDPVSAVSFMLQLAASDPAGGAFVTINQGSLNGPVLATSATVSFANIPVDPTAFAFIDFRFPVPVLLPAGVYFVQLNRTAPSVSSRVSSGNNTYAGGGFVDPTGTPDATNRDYSFRLYTVTSSHTVTLPGPDQAITADTLASTLTLRPPNVAVGAVTVTTPARTSTFALSAPSVAVGAATVTAAALASTLSLRQPKVAKEGATVPGFDFTDLVEWWDMSEPTGNITGQHAGLVMTAINNPGSDFINGVPARDFEFSNSTGFVCQTADIPTFSMGADTPFTIAVHFTQEDFPAFTTFGMVGKSDYAIDREYHLVWESTIGYSFYVHSDWGTFAKVTVNPTIAPNQPHTLFAWHDPVANTINIQFDGQAPVSAAWSGGTNDFGPIPFRIGRANEGGASVPFDGMMRSVSLWKRVLQDTERTTLCNGDDFLTYSNAKNGPTIIETTAMVDWWDMNEPSGNAIGSLNGTVLTQTGGTIGTGTIGSQPARDLEPANAECFQAADTPALSLGSDTPFTLALRARFRSDATMALLSKDDTSNREFLIYLQNLTGIRFFVWDSTGANSNLTHSVYPTVGPDYTIIVWHDPVANELGMYLNGYIERIPWTTGTRDSAATFLVGSGIGAPGAFSFNGLLGSTVYDKRVWSLEDMRRYHNGGQGISFAEATTPPGPTTPTITTAHVASTFASNPPSVTSIGVVTVTPPPLASTLTLRPPSVAAGAVTITPPTIGSTFNLRQPSVVVGAVTVTAPSLGSTFTLRAASVAAGAVTITPPTIGSSVVLYGASVLAGSTTVTAPTIGSTVVLSQPLVAPAGITVVGGALMPSTMVLRGASITTGPVAITGTTLGSTFVLRPASVTAGVVTVTTPTLASTMVLSGASVALSSQSVTLPTLASSFVLYPGEITGDVVLVSAAHLPSTSVFYPPKVLVGATTVVTPLLAASFSAIAPTVAPSDFHTWYGLNANKTVGVQLTPE